MERVDIGEAKSRLDDLIEAAIKGETVWITDGLARTVQLVPVTTHARRRKAGSAKGLISMTDDFDAPLEDFAEYQP